MHDRRKADVDDIYIGIGEDLGDRCRSRPSCSQRLAFSQFLVQVANGAHVEAITQLKQAVDVLDTDPGSENCNPISHCNDPRRVAPACAFKASSMTLKQ